MSTPTSEAFLAAFREFEMSTVHLTVDVYHTGEVSCWYDISLLNPDFAPGQGMPMTVDFTIRPVDLAVFCAVMLWDVAEVIEGATRRYQGIGLKQNPADAIDAAVEAATHLSRGALVEAANNSEGI